MAVEKENKTVEGFSERFATASNYGAELYYPATVSFITGSLIKIFTQNVSDIRAAHLNPGDLSNEFADISNEPLSFSIQPHSQPEPGFDNYPTIEDKERRISEIEDYVQILKGLEGPAQIVKAIEGERERSNAYKNIIAARHALKGVKFDEDGDGIITDDEFESVQDAQRTNVNSEWDMLKVQINILNQENTPNGMLLKRIEEGLTGQGLMNNDPDSLTTVGLIPTGAISALRGTIFGEGGKGKKNKSDDLWHHLLIFQDLQRQIAQLDEQIEQLDIKYAANIERIDKLQEEIAELDEMHRLLKEGKFEPEKPVYAALMQKYGIALKDLSNGKAEKIVIESLRERREANTMLVEKNQEIRQERADLYDKRTDLSGQLVKTQTELRTLRSQNGTDLPGIQKNIEQLEEQEDSLQSENIFTQNAQGILETHLPESSAENSLKTGVKAIFSDSSKTPLNQEYEVSHFMQKLAEFKNMEPEERLVAEYDLVKSLSPKSTKFLMQQDDTNALFGEGYFEEIGGDTHDIRTAANKITMPSNPSI